MCFYADEYDLPEIYSRKIQTARKQHKCSECGGKINPKERYEYVSGVWCGQFDVFKSCYSCIRLKDKVVEAELKAGCKWDNSHPPHGELLQAASEMGLLRRGVR